MSADIDTNKPLVSRPQWGSRFGFVLAAAGSAVGLGNIWKFPYITGENGGGLFVLIYLVCIALVGLPIMMAEIMIGRAAQKQPVGAFEILQGKKTIWTGIGWMGVAAGFIILSFYIVVAGWAMDYTMKSVVNFTHPIEEAALQEADNFIAVATPTEMRKLLVEESVKRQTPKIETQLKRRAAPSTWKRFQRYQTAVKASTDSHSESPLNPVLQKADQIVQEAERRLLLDPVIKSAVDEVQEIQQEIDTALAELRTKVEKENEAVTDDEVILQAKTLKRRALIFEKVSTAFGKVITNGWLCAMWATLFMTITVGVVASGVSSGIERACQIMMPTLFVLICIMVFYGMFQPGFQEALIFVFYPDPSKLKASGILEALGHAFFTLSLGMGAMMTYGSYQTSKTGLLQESFMITFLDTLIALLACLMIFPITFSYGQEAGAGPGLVFKSMPLAFAEIGNGGMLLAIMFFGLLFFAALTSAISLLEVIASYLIDQKGWSRPKAAITTGIITLVFSIPTAFAYDSSSLLRGWDDSYPMSFFDTMDHLASNWMLPLGGLFIALYAGWAMPRRLQEAEVTDMPGWAFQIWLLLVRLIAPALVVLVLLQKVGIMDIDNFLRW